jgi:hypothetical protein
LCTYSESKDNKTHLSGQRCKNSCSREPESSKMEKVRMETTLIVVCEVLDTS